MRLIPQDQQEAVLNRACSYIKSNYAFRIHDCSENVRIISGEEEGLFGWIAVNYLMDGFDAHEAGTGHHHDDKSSSTFGFLDMGGASTQIAFEPSPEEQVKHFDNLVEVNLRHLDGRTIAHPVFVTTWLGYGTNKARERYVAKEIELYKSTMADLARAAAANHITSSQAEKETQIVKDPCLPKQLVLSEAKHDGFMLQGTGEFEECVSRTSPLLNKNAPCLDEPCLFNGVHVPSIDFSVNHFIGISEYWYSTHDVWDAAGGVYDFVDFERNAVAYCNQEWDSILGDFSAGTRWNERVDLSRLQMQCFKAAWIINILHEGIGIPRIVDIHGLGDGKNVTEDIIVKAAEKGLADDSVKINRTPAHFQSVEQVGDVAISWTLGKMVLEVSQSIPKAEKEDKPHINWFGQRPDPSWPAGQRLRSSISALSQRHSYLGVLGFVVIFMIWLLCCRPGLGRRWGFSRYASLKRKSGGPEDLGLTMLEEGQNEYSSSDESTSSNPWKAGTSNDRNFFPYLKAKFWRQFRVFSRGKSKAYPGLGSPPVAFRPSTDHSSPRPRLRQVVSSPVLFSRASVPPGLAIYSPALDNSSRPVSRSRIEFNGLPSPPPSPRSSTRFGSNNHPTLTKKGSRGSLKSTLPGSTVVAHSKSTSDDYLSIRLGLPTQDVITPMEEELDSPALSRTSSMRPLSRKSSFANLNGRRKDAASNGSVDFQI